MSDTVAMVQLHHPPGKDGLPDMKDESEGKVAAYLNSGGLMQFRLISSSFTDE